jgi:hypothetical protein
MKFNDILASRRLTQTPLPIWKLQLTDEEFSGLKEELRDAFQGKNELLFRIAKEAALYYANWWSREYLGGIPSRERIAADLGLNLEQSNALYVTAKRGLSYLKISPIFRNGRMHRFRTLLMQGGLPLFSLKKGNNKAGYGAFFEGLIKYTNEVDVNYEDISFIDYLPCRNRLSSSFQTADFYELNLLIIEDFRKKGEQSEYWELISAIFDREECRENVSVQRIKKLLSEKKEKSDNRIQSFSVEWSLRKYETEVSLYYTLSIPPRIKQSEISETLRDQYEFSVFLDNKEVARYNRTLPDNNGDVFFVKVRGKNDLTEKCIANTDVVVRLSSNGLFKELPYSTPDFSEPILLTGLENLWYIKKKKQDNYVNGVLLLKDSEWEIITPESLTSVTFYGQEAFWTEAKELIELKNKSTEETLLFDNTPYLYRYEILHQPEIKSKNRKLINPKIKFQVIYTIDDMIINRDFEIYFRIKQGQWIQYNNPDCLPVGLLHFKFIYPDKKIEYANFFNIRNLSVSYSEQTTDSGVVTIANWNNLTLSISEQQGIKRIEKIEDNKWKFVRNVASRHYASNLQFRITDQHDCTADILIVAPFKGIVVAEISGDSIDNHHTISLDSLWRYKCFVFGENMVNVTIYHNRNENNQRIFIYNIEKKNAIPLLDFEESIRNLFTLFGADHSLYDSFVTIKFNNTQAIFVKPFNRSINLDEWKNNRIIRLDNDAKIEHLYAMTVDCDYPDEISTFELVKQGDNFVLPENIDYPNGLIVFSDDSDSVDKVRPTFLGMTQNTTTFDERLNNIRVEIAEARFHDYFWDKIAVYFQLLISNNLPLKTIDYFRIIAESPLSMAKLALVLLDPIKNITPDERKKGLLTFESEFALAWHWLDNSTWKTTREWWYLEQYDYMAELYIQDLLTYSLQINSDFMRQFYAFAMNNTMSEDCSIDEQIHIQDYTRYVDIHSDDWLSIDENNRIIYPKIAKNWQNLFSHEYGVAIRTFLWGGAKAALSAMGEDKDEQGNKLLWKSENETQRRIMFYFWKLNPETYKNIFFGMVKKINYRLNRHN